MLTIVSVTTFSNDENALEINFSDGSTMTIYNDNPEIIKCLNKFIEVTDETINYLNL